MIVRVQIPGDPLIRTLELPAAPARGDEVLFDMTVYVVRMVRWGDPEEIFIRLSKAAPNE